MNQAKANFLKHIIWLVPLLMNFTVGQAADGVKDIQGYIKDWYTGERLPYANIGLRESSQGTSSNVDGYFVLANAPTGLCSLQVNYIGYESKIIAYNNNKLIDELITIELKSNVMDMDKVEVVADAYEIFRPAENISQLSISPRELSILPSFGEVDIFRSLQLLPGISGVSNGKAGLYIRGGTPDQNMVILDGMTVYHVDHMFGMFSAFNPDAIKDVQVYKGGFPSKYGGRLSGIVELSGKTGGDRKQLSFGANMLSANVLFETPVFDDNARWLFSGRRSYTDILQSPFYNGIYTLITGDEAAATGSTGDIRGKSIAQEVTPSFYYYDLNTKLSFNPTNKDFISLSAYAGKDLLDKSQDLELPDRGFATTGGEQFSTRTDENLTDWGNLGTSAKWGHQWASRGFTNFLVSGTKYNSNYERELSIAGASVVGVDSSGASRGLGGFAQDEYNTVVDLTAKLDNQWQVNQHHKVEFGTNISSIQTDYEALIADSISLLDIHSQSLSTALYAQDNWALGPLLDITFGLRSTYYDQTQQFYHTPRLSFNYKLSQNLKLQGAWGQYYQYINNITNESVLQGSNDFWLTADENILPGFSEHSVLGLTYANSGYLFSVEGYYKTLNNLVEFSRRFQDNSDYMNYFFFGSGVSQGVEFLAQKKTGAFTGWLSYTISNVENTFPNMAEGVSFPANHDRPHELKLMGSYERGPWNFSSTFIYSSGNPYTAPESQYLLTMLDGEDLSYIHVGEKNAYRLPDYHRLDVSLSRNFESDSYNWDAGLSIYNLYNHDNVSFREYDLDVSPIIVSDVSMLGFTPTLFIKANLK
ncbi:MAG: TonB-dependent receptor [FCB group bacterium]|nr:TonB-dependent receptor [FCB group bacterium]MBL7123247.1 TonB-dependent receptor [Candidatus Neomarinimicrobiota bacterium]